MSFSQNPDGEIGTIQYGDYSLKWNITAKASEKEKTVSIENPDGLETAVTEFPNILRRQTFMPSEALDKNIFNSKIKDREYTLNTDTVAEIQTKDTLPLDEDSVELALTDLTSAVEYEDVLPSISFNYTVHPSKVKEDIVINKPTNVTSYNTCIETIGLTPVLLDDQSVQFQTNDGEIIFDIPAPFMYDSSEGYSEDIVVRLNIIDENTCELIYIPNYEWLNDSERVYPVTIDPTYQATPTMYGADKTQDTYVYSGSPNSNYYTNAYLKVGAGYESYVRYPTLPSISSNCIIHSARFQLMSTVSDSPIIRLCRVTSSWSSSAVTWNSNRPGAEAFLNLASQGQYYNTYEVTDVVSGWYSGKYGNYGFMIQSPYASSAITLYSSDCGNTNLMPGLQICYYPMSEVNLSTGVYYIRNKYNNKYLDVTDESSYNGSNVGVWDFTGRIAQQWYVQNLGGGMYYIRSNMNRNYSLDAYGGQDVDEANFNLWNNGNNKFRIREDNYRGAISVTPSFSNTRGLDVYLGSDPARYNANVQLCDYNSQSNQLWEFEEANSKIFGSVNALNQIAINYTGNNSASTKNLVFQFIRSKKYNSDDSNYKMWDQAAGPIDYNFIDYVNSVNSSLNFLRTSQIYLNDRDKGPIDFTHFAATADAIISPGTIPNITIPTTIKDLSGWAGDLQSLLSQTITITGNSNSYSTFYNTYISLLGESESVSSFSMPDLLADLDAKYFTETMGSGYLGDLLSNYYSSQYQNRISYFINYYITFNPGLPTYRDRLIAYAKLYTSNLNSVPVFQWPIFGDKIILSNQTQAAADAFIDYLLYSF